VCKDHEIRAYALARAKAKGKGGDEGRKEKKSSPGSRRVSWEEKTESLRTREKTTATSATLIDIIAISKGEEQQGGVRSQKGEGRCPP